MMPHASRDWKYLTGKLRLQPRGFNARFFTVIQKDSDLNSSAVYTVFDRILQVDNLEDFHLPWHEFLLDLHVKTGEGAERGGYLQGRQLANESRTDLMRAGLLKDFFEFRLRERTRKFRFQVDEVWQLYAALIGTSEEAKVVRTMQGKLNDIRGLNLPFDFGTARPASLQPEILEYVSNFFFGELRESGAERTRSSRGRMLEALKSRLPDSEKMFLPLVEKVMENVPLGRYHLFFMLGVDGRLRLVRPMLPTHMLESPHADMRSEFERFEEETGQRVLCSLNEVKRFTAEGSAMGRRREEKGEML